MIEIDFHTVLLWTVALIIFSFDLIVFIGSNKITSRIFCFFSLLVSFWSLSYGFFISFDSSFIPLILIKINHVLGIFASIGFVYFALSYPNDKKIPRSIIIYTTVFGVIYSYLILFTELLIKNMFEIAKPDRWGWEPGILYSTYGLIFASFWTYILVKIRKSKFEAKSSHDFINSKFMFWGLFLGIIPPLLLNIVLPTFKIYGYSWTGPIASAIWVFVIGYSIMRYRQMNVRVVITEMLAVAMTIIFFINIFVKAQFGTAENIMTFLIFLLIATYLIRTVLSEERIKAELRVLNLTLEDKVAEQTKEIRKSLDNEKHARRELEKLNETKNQFVMITQHSIRTPLQHIKLALDEIQNQIPADLQTRISQNTNRLTTIVDDFLNISTIDKNSKILNLESVELLPIVERVIADLSYEIEAKKIRVDVHTAGPHLPPVIIDKNRIYDALFIIIENAIKYNKTGGTVNVDIASHDKTFTISIKDSGIGLTVDDLGRLEKSLFYRSEKAKLENPVGMGIGLSVAKAIIKAHHGKLSITSSGINKGTTIRAEIPIDYLKEIVEVI